MKKTLWIVLAVVVIVALMGVGKYNQIVKLNQGVQEGWSQVENVLQRRNDLIPNLVKTVKSYAKHEKEIMTDVNNARKALVSAKGLPERIKADQKLEGVLGRLFAIAENYPQLRANENFKQLQEELTATEDRVAYSRQYYNDSILSYNNLCTTFPGKFFAGIYGRKEKAYIKITEAERKEVKVKF